MKKPVFWNTFAIYLLLYNNILIIISLILALKSVIKGNIAFTSAIWYQLLIFLMYILVIAGLIIGGKKGYFASILFIPVILLTYFYPPMIEAIFPKLMSSAFRLIETVSVLYLIFSPESIRYFKYSLQNKDN